MIFFFSYSLADWLWVLISMCMVLPVAVMVKNYKRSTMKDYLILGVAYLSALLNTFLTPLISHIQSSFLVKLTAVTFLSISFFVFLIAIRMKWDKLPKGIFYTGLVWYLVLVGYLAIQPNIIFHELNGQRMFIKQPILLFELAELYRIFSGTLMTYVAFSEKPLKRTKRVERSIMGWKAIGILLVLAGIVNLLTWIILCGILNPSVQMLMNTLFLVIIVVAGLITLWLSLYCPEAMLFTHVQFLRILELYDTVQKIGSEQIVQDIGMPTLVTYLKEIPPALIAEIQATKHQK